MYTYTTHDYIDVRISSIASILYINRSISTYMYLSVVYIHPYTS